MPIPDPSPATAAPRRPDPLHAASAGRAADLQRLLAETRELQEDALRIRVRYGEVTKAFAETLRRARENLASRRR